MLCHENETGLPTTLVLFAGLVSVTAGNGLYV